MSNFNSARRDAVDYSNRPVQEKFVEGEKNETEEKIDAREFPEELLIPCREEWGSYEGKCYKVYIVVSNLFMLNFLSHTYVKFDIF